jgi:ABC-type transport system substrate-binding protein
MPEHRNYWTALNRRISRRRALQGAAIGGIGLAGATYVACNDNGGGGNATATPGGSGEGTPKPGGVFHGTVGLVLGFDPIRATSFLAHALASPCYSRLMRYKTVVGELPEEDWYVPEPELASAVQNPDPLTYTFTIRPDAVWPSVAPINPPGRKVTASDVKYAWDYYQANSPNKANLGSLVDSVEVSADDTQITFHLKQQFGLFLNRIASFQDLWIMPKDLIEADGDGSKRMVGSGPFILDAAKTRTDVSLVYNKNPNYWEKDAQGTALPYLDSFELAVITDVNQVLSQFAAGNLDQISVPPQLLSSFQGQNPDAILDISARNVLSFFYFEPGSYTEDKPPFNDERVRRAFSMTLDRSALLNVASPEGGSWPNIVSAGMGPTWWLDPQGSDIGDAGQWYQFNLDEAKSLLDAASLASGFDVDMHFSSSIYSSVVPYYDLVRQVLGSMLGKSNIRVNDVPEEYGVYITTTFVDGPSSGMAWGLESVFTDVGMYLANMFKPRDAGGGRNHSQVNDAELVTMIDDMLAQTESEALQQSNFDIQRYVSDKMYYVPGVTPKEATASQPWVKNRPNVTGPTTYALGTEGVVGVWLDKTG